MVRIGAGKVVLLLHLLLDRADIVYLLLMNIVSIPVPTCMSSFRWVLKERALNTFNLLEYFLFKVTTALQHRLTVDLDRLL